MRMKNSSHDTRAHRIIDCTVSADMMKWLKDSAHKKPWRWCGQEQTRTLIIHGAGSKVAPIMTIGLRVEEDQGRDGDLTMIVGMVKSNGETLLSVKRDMVARSQTKTARTI